MKVSNWDIIPSWLEDPSAYAQPANLDMTTVLIVAATNVFVGVVCVSCFEIVRHKRPHIYSPKEALMPGSTPRVMHHPCSSKEVRRPLSWVGPLMRLDDETVLQCGGYDVLIYLRFIAMALRIFVSFTPYAFGILIPVHVSVSYFGDDGLDEGDNTFNRLSMSVMPMRDPRMWFHCLGVFILTGVTMSQLARECRWFVRLRHRFLLQREDVRQRTIVVKQLPTELRSSVKLAEYFHKLYPGKVVGATVCRRVDALDALVVLRERAAARLERVLNRRALSSSSSSSSCLKSGGGCECGSSGEELHEVDLTQHKLYGHALRPRRSAFSACWARYARATQAAHLLLEDVYDPLWWRCVHSLKERISWHQHDLLQLEQRIARERRRQAARDSFVGRPVHSMHAEECESAQRSALEDSAGSTLQSCRSSDEDLGLEEPTAASGEAECCDVEDETGCDGNGGGVLFEEWGEDGDARPWYRRLAHASLGEKGLQESQEEAASLLSGRLGSSGAPRRSARLNMMGDKAFVTFSAFTGAAVATQVFHAATPGGMVAHMAPEPRDVLWGNVRVSSKQRTTRRVLAYAMVGLLLVFYVVPVTLISFVLSEQALDASFPALKQLAKDNFVVDATVKMMQPSGLIALMLLLPPLFLGLGCWEGTLSLSQASFAQLSRYYSFQITNVLLVTTVAGSVINCIRSIVDNPKYTFSLLGESLPQVCAFFSCYIFIKALSGLTIELCRAVAAMQQCVKRCVYPSASPRDRAADVLGLRCFEHPGWFSYGKFGAQDLLVVVLLMVYAVMAPLILVPGIAFFAIGSVVYRHQFLYVYVPVFESGGLLWPRIYRRTLFSLFIMQFTMVGMFFLKHAFYQGYAVLALSCATYLFKMQMRTMYITSSSVSHHLPMELATAVDDAMRYEHDTKPDHKKASDDALRAGLRDYLQPALWI